MDMGTLLQGRHPTVTKTTLRQGRRIAQGMLVMTGRVTMWGLSRWAGPGGSSRTGQRCVATGRPWATRFWVFFCPQVSRPDAVSLVAGDAVVVTKAGKSTHGLDRFFARLYGKPVPGLAFFPRSLVRVQPRRALPLRVDQIVRRDAEQAASKATATAKQSKASGAKRRPGRPKGRKNTPRAAVTCTPELVRITRGMEALLPLIAGVLSVPSLVLDGHFSNHNAFHAMLPKVVDVYAMSCQQRSRRVIRKSVIKIKDDGDNIVRDRHRSLLGKYTTARSLTGDTRLLLFGLVTVSVFLDLVTRH